MLRECAFSVEAVNAVEQSELKEHAFGGTGLRDEPPADAPEQCDDDPQYVADMQARETMRQLGYRDALCLACGCLLYVETGSRGDVLCPQCEREGNELAAEDDTDPRPPAGGAVRPEVQRWASFAAKCSDQMLMSGIGMADEKPESLPLDTPADVADFLDALSAEVLRRLELRQTAAA